MKGLRRRLGLLTIGAGILAASCGAAAGVGFTAEVASATDLDPAREIVEVSLVATPAEATLLPGTRASVWAYRDAASERAASIPGPIIEANVGDHVIVHLKNELPEPTTIHWHGVRVPARSDGYARCSGRRRSG